MEVGGKGLSSSERLLGETEGMWEAMRGHTRWALSSEKEGGDPKSSGGWGHPHLPPSLDEALWV